MCECYSTTDGSVCVRSVCVRSVGGRAMTCTLCGVSITFLFSHDHIYTPVVPVTSTVTSAASVSEQQEQQEQQKCSSCIRDEQLAIGIHSTTLKLPAANRQRLAYYLSLHYQSQF